MRTVPFLFLAILLQHCQPTVNQTDDSPPADTTAVAPPEGFAQEFLAISDEGRPLPLPSDLTVNNEGGHLQGAQLVPHHEQHYVLLSGSSSTYSYLAAGRLSDDRQMLYLHKILDKPYKHAGGFQVQDGWLAIGVEDNELKNRSKVFVYRLEDPARPPAEPAAVIERRGEVMRATAGAVGLVPTNEDILMVVGDWDSRHLDFYLAPAGDSALTFEQVHTIDTETTDRTGWSDDRWLAYQNINLFSDNEKLYLVGLTSQSPTEEAADLYELQRDPGRQSFRLRKVASRVLHGNDRTKFRWGAGLYRAANGQLQIISCGENIGNQVHLTIYGASF